jgi:hypothetical protein
MTQAAPQSQDDKLSSISVTDRSEDPVSSLLGGGGGSGAGGETSMKSPNAQITAAVYTTPSTPTRTESTSSSITASNNNDDVDQLNATLSNLLLGKQIPQSSISALQSILRDNATLKEKNSKLKSLLGRSAKAQRDAKNELEHIKKLYEEIRQSNEKLERRVEVLSNRPTHMDLLADFETNFDRAMLAIGETTNNTDDDLNDDNDDDDGGGFVISQQSCGEDAAESPSGLMGMDTTAAATSLYEELNRPITTTANSNNSTSSSNRRQSSNTRNNNTDSLLLSELTEAKSRIQQLESLNTSMTNRYNHLEHTHKSLVTEYTSKKNTITNLQLELRMSRMETEHAQRSLREKESVIAEMQLEINLVTQSAVEANKRAAEGMEVVQSVRMDKEYVDGLEAKVVALQDWALASTESKQMANERCRGLESRVKELQQMVELLQQRNNSGSGGGEGEGGLISVDEGLGGLNINDLVPLKKASGSSASSLASSQGAGCSSERKLWTKSSSLVVGAGMVGQTFFELGNVQIEAYETVILRWKFDLTRDEEDVYFSILKGICEDKRKQRSADACFRNRHVKGGGGGDVSGAFAIQNACTLVWSNEMSWFRPKTIKWTVDAVAIEWSD